ncbi:putative heteroproteinous nuclear ribonucleoprotein [Hibiscus syriacus]|uniref:Heteroproteinous nuclear ribonucleoprotein n=1 Tax=Hibiscus syriacus TaxID=106335 RepID=A0A6A2WE45_HIBSY|nr:cyclin-dependent protein kinase inhibitor SMR13-like [Hibiscus syriacus]KAE8656683.1 putative heteroproteinous nuclear ribonucleoprotein [Hibiscus syriacus]
MAPSSGRGKTTRKASKHRRRRDTKKLVKSNNFNTQTTSPVSEDLRSEMDGFDHSEGVDDIATACPCSTPKAKRFRIPEIDTCPPAPKKRRPLPSNCSLRRTPIAFFAPPDIELFFVCAFRDISV